MCFRNQYKICLAKHKERECSVVLGIDRKIISNWALKSQMWGALKWFTVRCKGGIF
jgi:hypothetical protein